MRFLCPCTDGVRLYARFWRVGQIGTDGGLIVDIIAIVIDVTIVVRVRCLVIVVAWRAQPPSTFQPHPLHHPGFWPRRVCNRFRSLLIHAPIRF